MLTFFLFFTYIFIAGNMSISMNIMCVILCLFSSLSRRVGALLSIIIVINTSWQFKQPKQNAQKTPGNMLNTSWQFKQPNHTHTHTHTHKPRRQGNLLNASWQFNQPTPKTTPTTTTTKNFPKDTGQSAQDFVANETTKPKQKQTKIPRTNRAIH